MPNLMGPQKNVVFFNPKPSESYPHILTTTIRHPDAIS